MSSDAQAGNICNSTVLRLFPDQNSDGICCNSCGNARMTFASAPMTRQIWDEEVVIAQISGNCSPTGASVKASMDENKCTLSLSVEFREGQYFRIGGFLRVVHARDVSRLIQSSTVLFEVFVWGMACGSGDPTWLSTYTWNIMMCRGGWEDAAYYSRYALPRRGMGWSPPVSSMHYRAIGSAELCSECQAQILQRRRNGQTVMSSFRKCPGEQGIMVSLVLSIDGEDERERKVTGQLRYGEHVTGVSARDDVLLLCSQPPSIESRSSATSHTHTPLPPA